MCCAVLLCVFSVGQRVEVSGRDPQGPRLSGVLPAAALHASLAEQVGLLHAAVLAAAGRPQVQHLPAGQWRADAQDLRGGANAHNTCNSEVVLAIIFLVVDESYSACVLAST